MKYGTLFFSLLILVVSFWTPVGYVHAQSDGTLVDGNIKYVPLEPLSSNPYQQPPQNFCDMLNLLFRVFIYVGGMLAVLYLVIGGITYMVSEVVDKRSKARSRIRAAIYGLLILLCSWIILNTINPQLVNSCNLLAPANATGVLKNTTTPTTPQPELPTQTPITPNTPLSGPGSNTIEELVPRGKQVIKDSSGNVLTLNTYTVNYPGSITEAINQFRTTCTQTGGSGVSIISGIKIGQPANTSLYVCTK